VQENLLHFDGERYRVLAWCLMPNHVHALIEIWQTPLAELLHSWKSYTSKQANKILGRTGRFWQDEYFDRYVRDEAHLRKVVHYVENNPVKAGLARQPAEWPWSSARWRDEHCRLRLNDGSAASPAGQSVGAPPEDRSAGGPPAKPSE
jgi:REP element-mobilizing transposase RayT